MPDAALPRRSQTLRARLLIPLALLVAAATGSYAVCFRTRAAAIDECELQRAAPARLIEPDFLVEGARVLVAGSLDPRMRVGDEGDVFVGRSGTWFFSGGRANLVGRNCEKAVELNNPFFTTAAVAIAARAVGLACSAQHAEVKGNLRALVAALETTRQATGQYPQTAELVEWTYRGTGYQYSFLVRTTASEFDALALGVGNAVNGDVWRASNLAGLEHVNDVCAFSALLSP